MNYSGENDMSRSTTDKDFGRDVLESKGVSVVDLWAEWCGPCRVLGPTIDEIATERQGTLNVFKLDVDSNPETPSRYGIRGIPTLLFFKDGQLVDQLVGAHPKTRILKKIDQL
jgi:thioredoxin 1